MNASAVLFIYYKVNADQHHTLAPRVRELQSHLQTRHPGLSCELLQRPVAAQGIETWMESYRHPTGVDDQLAAAIEAAALAASLPLPRHTERFIRLT